MWFLSGFHSCITVVAQKAALIGLLQGIHFERAMLFYVGLPLRWKALEAPVLVSLIAFIWEILWANCFKENELSAQLWWNL